MGNIIMYNNKLNQANEWFEMTIDTTIVGATPSDTFWLPMNTIHLTIDWGEGDGVTYIPNITGNTDSRLTKQYAVSGIYTIRMKGSGSLSLRTTAERNKVLSIDNWGVFEFTSLNAIFRDATTMVVNATDTMHYIGTAYLNDICREAVNITAPPRIIWSRILSIQGMFFGSDSLNADLGYMDLRNCIYFVQFAANVVTWSQENYSNTLMGWLRWDSNTHAPAVGWELKSNQTFYGGNSTVAIGSEAALARQYYIDTLGWSIIDGGLV